MKNKSIKVLLVLLSCLLAVVLLTAALLTAGKREDGRTPLTWLVLLLPVLLLSLLGLFAGGRSAERTGGRRAAIVAVSLLLILSTLGLSAGIVLSAAGQGDEPSPAPVHDGWLMRWSRKKPPVFDPTDRKTEDTETGDNPDEPWKPGIPLLGTDGAIGSPMDESVGGAGEKQPVFRVTADTDGLLYLQVKSFGDYEGQSWADAPDFAGAAEEGFSPRTQAAIRLTDAGAAVHTLVLERMRGDFAVPYYYLGADGECTVTDTAVTGGGDKIYTLTYCRDDDPDMSGLGGGRALSYNRYAQDTYLALPAQVKGYFTDMARENGLLLPQNSSVQEKLAAVDKAAALIRDAAEYNLYYDRALDGEAFVAVSFLTTYRQGICSHFASAATLLLRAMGLPARYTIGYLAETAAGETVAVTTDDAHAWVEVWLDNIGWIPVEVTGTTQDMKSLNTGVPDGTAGTLIPGTLPEELSSYVTLTPRLTEHKDDGSAVKPLQELSGFEPLASLGFTYTCTVEGEASEIGYTPTYVSALTILDPEGRDVTNQLHPSVGTGFIHIYYDDILTESRDVTQEYDGRSVSVPPELVLVADGGLMPGHRVTVTTQPLSGEVGTRPVLYDVRVLDADGVDCTDLYRIVRKAGMLQVTPPVLRLRAADASKPYDGTPLVCDEYTVTGGSLLEGDVLAACPVAGSQTGIGRSDNIIDLSGIRILNADGADVTMCYRIETENGTLRVTP